MIKERINSYPSIYAVGHKAIRDIFDSDVVIEEKVDGSQFSFGVGDNGELHCRSKGAQIVIDAPEKMFARAVETVKEIQHLLVSNWIYRCEYLQKPKHNTLAYKRVPKKYLILFDVMTGLEEYLLPADKASEATRIKLEVVPTVFQGRITEIDMLNELLERKSILGGCTIEGVVIKNYTQFTHEKKIAIAKYVSEKFKEKHSQNWKKSNPSANDIVQLLIATYRNETRWEKAVQHLRDEGKLECSPRDIGALIREIPIDVLKECEDEIKDRLFKHFWPKVRRGITAGLPEWYKEQLAASAFEV